MRNSLQKRKCLFPGLGSLRETAFWPRFWKIGNFIIIVNKYSAEEGLDPPQKTTKKKNNNNNNNNSHTKKDFGMFGNFTIIVNRLCSRGIRQHTHTHTRFWKVWKFDGNSQQILCRRGIRPKHSGIRPKQQQQQTNKQKLGGQTMVDKRRMQSLFNL